MQPGHGLVGALIRQLYKHHVCGDVLCLICGEEEESIEHLFFDCLKSKQ